jgi:Acyl-CoA dehydrogenase, N-terminal domain.
MTTDLSASHPALTTLSEEESAFRDAVAAFAEQEVRPRVQEMERAARIDPTLIPALFELGSWESRSARSTAVPRARS